MLTYPPNGPSVLSFFSLGHDFAIASFRASLLINALQVAIKFKATTPLGTYTLDI